MATGSTPPMTGLTGQDDVSVENAHMVGDVQTVFKRAFDQNRYLRDEILVMQARHDFEMAQMRVDMRHAHQDVRQAQTTTSHNNHNTRLGFVDVNAMSPSIFDVLKTGHALSQVQQL